MSDEIERRIEAYLRAVDGRPTVTEIAAAVACSTSAAMRVLRKMDRGHGAEREVTEDCGGPAHQ
jgi:hypothetical protein